MNSMNNEFRIKKKNLSFGNAFQFISFEHFSRKILFLSENPWQSCLRFIFQTLAIDKWNTDSVEEFLDIYLMKEDETSAAQETLP